jgi:hypothetical protein
MDLAVLLSFSFKIIRIFATKTQRHEEKELKGETQLTTGFS